MSIDHSSVPIRPSVLLSPGGVVGMHSSLLLPALLLSLVLVAGRLDPFQAARITVEGVGGFSVPNADSSAAGGGLGGGFATNNVGGAAAGGDFIAMGSSANLPAVVTAEVAAGAGGAALPLSIAPALLSI